MSSNSMARGQHAAAKGRTESACTWKGHVWLRSKNETHTTRLKHADFHGTEEPDVASGGAGAP